MSNQNQTTPENQPGRQAGSQPDQAGKQAQGGEIRPSTPDHDKKPETADEGNGSATKTGKSS